QAKLPRERDAHRHSVSTGRECIARDTSEQGPRLYWTFRAAHDFSNRGPLPDPRDTGRAWHGGGLSHTRLEAQSRRGAEVLVAEYTQDAERVRRFKQEPIAASALNHPAIPSMLNRHQVKDPFYHHTVYA